MCLFLSAVNFTVEQSDLPGTQSWDTTDSLTLAINPNHVRCEATQKGTMNRGTWSRAECWARMRILCCILLCFCLMGCGRDARDESAIIRRRAEQFGDLLVRIQDMPELEAKRTLEGFIEPSPTRADRLAQYYREFSAASEKFRIVSQTVENIRISSDRVNAEVTYGMIAQPPGGTSISALQVTHWKHVGGKWYRTVGEAQKRLDL